MFDYTKHLFVRDRKSTRLNSSHLGISYAVFCLKTKKHTSELQTLRQLACPILIETTSSAGASTTTAPSATVAPAATTAAVPAAPTTTTPALTETAATGVPDTP